MSKIKAINLIEDYIIERIGLSKYPTEEYSIFELPVRKNRGYYQVWTGKRWTKLEISPIITKSKKKI